MVGLGELQEMVHHRGGLVHVGSGSGVAQRGAPVRLRWGTVSAG